MADPTVDSTAGGQTAVSMDKPGKAASAAMPQMAIIKSTDNGGFLIECMTKKAGKPEINVFKTGDEAAGYLASKFGWTAPSTSEPDEDDSAAAPDDTADAGQPAGSSTGDQGAAPDSNYTAQ